MMTDKEAQLKAKLLKMKLAAVKKKKLSWKDKVRINNPVNPPNVAPSSVKKEGEIGEGGGLSDLQEHKLRRGIGARRPESETLDKMEGKFITEENAKKYAISTAKAKIKKLKKTPIKTMEKRGLPENILEDAAAEAGVDENQSPSYIAKDHGHRISFRSHSAGNFKTASLNEQSGKYAKYWLLNAKDTNGNGWGIASHTAKENMKKFIGRPLVVTASSWHGASEYGDEYEHPYLPTNDITAILDHQEKFRVGSIVDVVEDSHGDWFASVEMLPKFASSRLPPFCSPAIYQLDASEAEGQISKWEALHLAALTENPAYGARIALLKGTCVGTGSECKVQFKVAKQEATTVCPKKKQKISRLKSRLAVKSEEDPTEKLIKQVKDPKNKEDLLNRLDEKPNEYGPKNFGGTKRKDFGKRIGKLKQRLAGDNWSAVEDDDFFTKPYKAPPVEYNKEYGFSAMDHISNLHDESSYNAGQNAMKKFEGLSHPLSKKFAYNAMDGHLYNSSLMLQNNYPDIEDIVGNNDKDSLYNLLQGHNSDTLEYANYKVEDAFGFGEEAPRPKNKGEEMGRGIGEIFDQMKDEQYDQIPDRKGDMLKTKDIINEYTNDVAGGMMKSFGKYTKHPLQAKLRISKLKAKIAAVKLANFGLPPKHIMDSFLNKKPMSMDKKVKFKTDGKNLFYGDHQEGDLFSGSYKKVPHIIAKHDKKGILASFQGYDSSTTSQALRMLGIDTRKRKGVTYLNNKEVDPSKNDYHLVPHSDIQKEKIIINEKLRGKKNTKEQAEISADQESFRKDVRKEHFGDSTAIGQDPTVIDNKGQKYVNSVTGINSKMPGETKGTKSHHLLFKEKYPGLRTNVNNGIPLSNKSHNELHSLNRMSKLKARLAGLGDENMTYQDSKKVKLHKTKNMGKNDKD